jgi:putative flavoprotein involved in K+ transport
MERVNTLVIGGGQAGLATGYHLKEKGIEFLILDAHARTGDSWRIRWDTLRLFTSTEINGLPGMPFPDGPTKNYCPSKDEAADYLEAYAKKFSLPIRHGVEVDRLRKQGDKYIVSAGAQQFEADNVVIATGNYKRPRIPEWASELDASIKQIHSSEYKNPAGFPTGKTLLMGAAASGTQIALDLAGAGRTGLYLAGKNVPVIPKRILGIIRKEKMFKFITTRTLNSKIGKKLAAGTGTAPLHGHLGNPYKMLAKAGVERTARVSGALDGKPVLQDGRILHDVDNIIWCLGFDPDYSWIDLPIFDEKGKPKQQLGVVDGQPGLYFMGLLFQHSISSSLFYGVGRDAQHIVGDIVRRKGERPALQAAPVKQPAAAT